MPDMGVQIGGGFTEGELQFASFWARNRVVLTRAGYALLSVLNILLWGFVVWTLLEVFVISYPRESRITAEIAANQVMLDVLQQDAPQNIDAAAAVVLPTTDGRYDMAVDVKNPNAQWWAEFNYRFNLSGEMTPLRTGFVMPASPAVITELGFRPANRGGATAQLEVENVRWHRLDPAQVKTAYKEYELHRFNVAFENVSYERDLVIGARQIGRSSFDVVNRGSFGYWSMDVLVRLYRGSSVIAMNRIALTQVRPGETRHIDLDWFENIPSVSKTEIIPMLNFLDEATYLPTTQF